MTEYHGILFKLISALTLSPVSLEMVAGALPLSMPGREAETWYFPGGTSLKTIMLWPPLPFDWAAIGFAICSVIGIVFGVYPAWKASNLDPIDALRYE